MAGPRRRGARSRAFSARRDRYRLRDLFLNDHRPKTRRQRAVEASLWTRCMGALEAELPEQQFNTWVRPLQALEGNGALKLLAPNRFVVDWVNANLLPRIGELLRHGASGDAPIITVEVGSRSQSARSAPAAAANGRPRPAEGLVVGARINPDFTFSSFVEGKSN